MSDIRLLRVTTSGHAARYYSGGRRITAARYQDIWTAANRLDCLHTVQRNGRWFHYSQARMAAA